MKHLSYTASIIANHLSFEKFSRSWLGPFPCSSVLMPSLHKSVLSTVSTTLPYAQISTSHFVHNSPHPAILWQLGAVTDLARSRAPPSRQCPCLTFPQRRGHFPIPAPFAELEHLLSTLQKISTTQPALHTHVQQFESLGRLWRRGNWCESVWK